MWGLDSKSTKQGSHQKEVRGWEEREKNYPLKWHKCLRVDSLSLPFSFTEIEGPKILVVESTTGPTHIQLWKRGFSCRPTASFLATQPGDKSKQDWAEGDFFNSFFLITSSIQVLRDFEDMPGRRGGLRRVPWIANTMAGFKVVAEIRADRRGLCRIFPFGSFVWEEPKKK